MSVQFIQGDEICCVYTIDVVTPSGMKTSAEVVDIVNIRGDRIAKEKVYLANPVKFAEDMVFWLTT